jgi:RimJ/RimL family protein N-acetyltransferase
MIVTPRLRLRPWGDDHREAFAAMNADPQVMADLGGPIDRAESDAKLDRYASWFQAHGVSRWAVEDPLGQFLGYAGVCPRLRPDHPLGAHFEVGWRFTRQAWGFGYATEAARAALDDAFARRPLLEIVSYTAPDNPRSQAVMERLGLERDPSRDFTDRDGDGALWSGWVWVARPPGR